MAQVLIVVDQLRDWAPYYPSEQVVSFEQYLDNPPNGNERVRVINLCRDYRYLSEGYYCSLLAEARRHHVIPSSQVLNDISNPLLYELRLGELSAKLKKLDHKKTGASEEPGETRIVAKSYFGQVQDERLKPLARMLFERFPCPILEITLAYQTTWVIAGLRLVDHRGLNDAEETEFANALDTFSKNVWRGVKAAKVARYSLAMLVDPEEKMPPSDSVALKKFIAAGRDLNIEVEQVTASDFMRLPEYDALFIRATTAIDHYTYRFAKKAEAEGMVVIDDPTSILRCTNKIFLADLFNTHKVPAPRTLILQRDKPQALVDAVTQLGLPLVLKVPDGAFSRGMAKVESLQEFEEKSAPLFQQSSLLLAQEFLYTDFDWRIGVLNNQPLYACRYFMVKNHWQIYRHSDGMKTDSGRYETLAISDVPKPVLQAALKATRPIGDGLYGVDVKESAGKGYVIEVNDNPNIDSAVEDKYLGKSLYLQIMQEFIRRIEANRYG